MARQGKVGPGMAGQGRAGQGAAGRGRARQGMAQFQSFKINKLEHVD